MTKIMGLADAERLAENMALGQFLSDWDVDATNYDEIMESLTKGEIPDDVYVWEVVENEPPEVLANLIEGMRNDFMHFYLKVVDFS